VIFFVLWTGLLLMLFTHRLRRGLNRCVESLARDLVQTRLARGLFPKIEQAVREIEVQRTRLTALAESTAELRHQIAVSPGLGAPRSPMGEAVMVPSRT
jgi:hypothetical protein